MRNFSLPVVTLLAAFAFLGTAKAAELPMVRITSNATPIVFDFKAVTDDATGELKGMSLYQDGEQVRYNTFDEVKQGITILKVHRMGITVTITKLRGSSDL